MQENVINQIRDLVNRYVKSIDDANVALASEIWMDSPEVTFIHPKGHEHGFEEIKQNFYINLMGETFSERKLDFYDLSFHTYGDTAIVEFYWHFIAKFKIDGSSKKTSGRETQIYNKDNKNQWKLIHVHYSGMPVTEIREGF